MSSSQDTRSGYDDQQVGGEVAANSVIATGPRNQNP